MPDKQEILSY